ncbi:unnamed protein product [Rotaria sordida]|uniref:Inversin n=1 Tax=Rotaria sordida TaxID=392033 RepID=A0A814DRP1_9BILA|nr:unnamed protein product [Rotaria sordida]
MSTLLFEACEKSDSNQVEFLIDAKYNINQLDKQGRSALHYCCNSTITDCAYLLLKDDLIKNTILNLQDNEGCSALHLACMNGNEIMVKFLCEQGADVKLLDNKSRSVIHWITVCGYVHLFNILIKYKAPIHIPDIHGAFPIHYASQLGGNISVNKDFKIDSGKGLAILQKIIDYRVDIDCVDEQQRTPFMWAASAGTIDQLRLLYKYGANQLHVDKNSLTALHCAANHGHVSCIHMLVEHCKCPIEDYLGEDINGCTALFYTIMYNHSNACKLLLDLKSNPNHKDKRGRTPSHYAICNGNLDCLKYLIKSNANIWIKNKRGDYPIHEVINILSLKKVHNQTIEYSKIFAVIRYIFLIYPKKINIQNDEHRTPLHLAASLGDIDTCQILIECGARINSFMRNSSGDYLTPYDLARNCHQNVCAQYLLYKHGGQCGNLLANIFVRRIQKYYHQYKLQKDALITKQKNSDYKIKNDSLKKPINYSLNLSTNLKPNLSKQTKTHLDNKNLPNCPRSHSLSLQSSVTNTSKSNENHVQERRRNFAKSKTTKTSINQSDDSKLDSSNKIIIHTSHSTTTYTKLCDRRKIIVEELHKLKQARTHNNYIVINRSLYKILIENAYNPQNRSIDEIEKYLETLVTSYDTELEVMRKRTSSLPPKQNRRTSIMF